MMFLVLLLLGTSVSGQLQCGYTPIPQSRVIGGQDAKPGAWPWQIALQRYGSFICGGSLISENWVVTAAHCVAGSSNPANYRIVVGDHNRNVNEGTEESVGAAQIISHPQYNSPGRLNNDIALIKLATSVKLSARVNPVCLPSSDSNVPTGSKCYITGWGKIKHPGGSHPILQQAMMPPIDPAKCRQKIQASGVSITLTPQMLCAGVDNSILSGCHGDSGGPYVCLNADGNTYTLHGAVSWGSSRCDAKQLFSVFARVTQYRAWIKQHTGISGGGGPPPSPPIPTTSGCGGSPTPPVAPECSNYQVLSENDRNTAYKGSVKCDNSMATRWYRFQGGAGSQMPTKCVPINQCGTHAPGWLSDGHPTVNEGAVQRKVCFHWSSNCCRWSSNIRVRNCGGFFVYELVRPPACSLRYCGEKAQGGSPPPPVTTAPPVAPECSNYQVLSENDRNTAYKGSVKCDNSMATRWYRFQGGAGSQMPTKCVPINQCGTHAPGWLSDGHPTVNEGAVQRKACFHWSSNCCRWSSNIRVRNCGGFFVYELVRPPACSLRYCGEKAQGGSPPPPVTTAPPVAPECSNYQALSENDRNTGYKGAIKCDRPLPAGKRWYRFQGGAGTQMPTKCVPRYYCGTHAPGWLSDAHPTVGEGAVQRKVCFHWTSGCCQWSSNINVRNCGGFFVYELVEPPGCSMRYCGETFQGGSPPPPSTPPPVIFACSNYKVLNERDRITTYKGSVKCDSSLGKGWYRFAGDAGTQMPTKCVPKLQCGTHAPGWLSGAHPTVGEGAVQRKVCFHWSSGCCQWSSNILVRNCGGFFVYELDRPPACSLRYCGEKTQGCSSSTPPPPGPTTPVNAQECSSYQVLKDFDRAKGFQGGAVKCDRSGFVKAWYKFEGGAGDKMPDACVPTSRCGTHAPGWLSDGHPAVADGAASRKVCFHWSGNCCRWSRNVRVRNCGNFYVYELPPTEYCSLRYCGNRERATPIPPTGPPPSPGACGVRPHSRIVGGVNAKHGDWPWQVQLRTTGGFPYCGGSLVHPEWIVTATHCIEGKSPNSIVIRLGAHRRVNDVGTEQDIRVIKVIEHPQYHQPYRYSNDIALLKLERPAQLNRYVNLVCLPQSVPAPTDGTRCWITGWGRLASGGATPDYLQQVQVPVVSYARCNRAYPGKIHDSMICAGLDQGGIDSCQGDSGGPMVCETGGRFYLHGATSWGYGCASPGKFGVYAKVKYELNWLNSEMSKN